MNKDLLIAILCLLLSAILPLFFFGIKFYSLESHEIQLHDIYIVFPTLYIIFIITGPVLFISFLIQGIMTKFRNVLTWIFLALGTVMILLILFALYQLLTNL